MNVQISKIYSGICTYGVYAGRTLHFVRFFGGGREDSKNHYREMDTEEVVQTITPNPFSVPVCFQGGEPLFQREALIDCIKILREEERSNPTDRLVILESDGSVFTSELAEEEDLCFSCSPRFLPYRENNKLTAVGQAELLKWIETRLKKWDVYVSRIQFHFAVEKEDQFDPILIWLSEMIKVQDREKVPVCFSGRVPWSVRAYKQVSDLGFSEIRFQVV